LKKKKDKIFLDIKVRIERKKSKKILQSTKSGVKSKNEKNISNILKKKIGKNISRQKIRIEGGKQKLFQLFGSKK
jgi:hypothetical protein